MTRKFKQFDCVFILEGCTEHQKETIQGKFGYVYYCEDYQEGDFLLPPADGFCYVHSAEHAINGLLEENVVYIGSFELYIQLALAKRMSGVNPALEAIQNRPDINNYLVSTDLERIARMLIGPFELKILRDYIDHHYGLGEFYTEQWNHYDPKQSVFG